MDNYDEKLNYSFEPADPAPAEPAQPLQQAKEEIRRSGRHTGLKIAALLTVVAIVAAAGGYALKQAIAALGEKNLAGQQTSVDAMAEQTVEPEPAAETAAQPTDDKGAYRLERRPLPDTLPSNDTGKTLTPTQVYQMNVGAVCGIATQVTTNVWGQTTTSACTGSGFVLTEDGYIVTNNHVVADASEGSIVVQLYSGEEYPAAIVGTDSMNDVALLKIEAEGLQTITIGDSDQIEVGETVEAIGNPLGELTFTMTAGYISALDREITPDRTPINMLQTDVAINAGNSGGPLFDMDGNVIGMTTAKVSGTTESGVSIEGLGFAIPINDVMRVVYDLQRYGRVLGRAYLGVTLQDLDSEVAATYNLPAGPQIVTVTEGSCAETAGLQPRDIILQFEDREISSFTDLSAALAKQKAGDTVTLKIYRAGAELEITLTLDERPGESEIDATEQQAQAELEGQTAPDTDIPDFGGFEGYGYDYGGITREENQQSGTTMIIFGICFLMIYLILSALYESFIIPFAVLLSVPCGLMGSFLFARIFGLENNIYLQTGLIMLIGLLAKTAILLTEYAAERRKAGMGLIASAVSAAKARLRPILMTALTMIFGLFPLMMSSGVGANGNRSLGTGVVGGMTIGTLALLFIVPTLFIAFQWLQERLRPVQSAPTHDWQIEEEIKVSEEEKSKAGKE